MVIGNVSQHLLLLLGLVQLWLARVSTQVKNDSACYGTFNGYLNLVCEPGQHVRVVTTMYGVKPTDLECERFATMSHPQPECCTPEPDDCVIYPPPGGPTKCPIDVPTCNLVANWVNTYTDCDQSVYPLTTNYMSVRYTCEKDEPQLIDRVIETGQETPAPKDPSQPDQEGPGGNTQKQTTPGSFVAPEQIDAEGPGVAPGVDQTETEDSEVNTTFSVILTNEGHSSNVELSDSMVAAVVGGSIGMCLTLVLFIFYWGRKKRLRIVSNKQPTVWDYLLTNTFTVRGYNGYDHFSSKSTRSSASSEGDSGSPVIRKNMWLPNIIQTTNDPQDDVISNYDNTNYKVPKVEVHPRATPSPYAILNLETLHTGRQRDNHEV